MRDDDDSDSDDARMSGLQLLQKRAVVDQLQWLFFVLQQLSLSFAVGKSGQGCKLDGRGSNGSGTALGNREGLLLPLTMSRRIMPQQAQAPQQMGSLMISVFVAVGVGVSAGDARTIEAGGRFD